MDPFWAIRNFPGTTDGTDALREARQATSAARDADDRLDRAILATEAVWSLVRDKLGLTDVELVERMNAVDLSDGKLDGKNHKPVVACPSCGRTISQRRARCMYCGQPIVHSPFA